MPEAAAADRQRAPHRRLVVATAIEGDAEDDLLRVGWPLTALRLALEPERHPWERGWRLRRRAPLLAVSAALLLLLLFALGGCTPVPPQSLLKSVSAPRPAAGARCDTLLVSRELQIPPEGELADLRLTLAGIPEALGQLRVLVRRPRFASGLELEALLQPSFDRILSIAPQRELTVVLPRPADARDDWPRASCKACRVEVELTGLFGVREVLDSFFALAVQDADAIEAAFAAQSPEPATRPGRALRQLAERLAAEAERCGVRRLPGLATVVRSLDLLDRARARLYAGERPALPGAAEALDAWDAAAAELEQLPWATAAARAAGWPPTLRRRGARLRVAARTLNLVTQVAALPEEDGPIAASWIAVAMAPDAAALERRIGALPRVRDLADAAARLQWVDPHDEVPLPGASQPLPLRVVDWRAARHGRRCIGAGGAVPVRDPDLDALVVARALGADEAGRLRPARAAELPATRATLERAGELLCAPPGVDVSELFAGLEGKDLGPVAERLRELFQQAGPRDRDPIAEAVFARGQALLCRLFDGETLRRRLDSVAAYKVFVGGGAEVLELLPGPLSCGGKLLAAAEVRRRLREAYRAALDKHALANQLCPLRGGRCPEEAAASVQRLFQLVQPALAAPAAPQGRSLDFPPPFGFSDEWVHKLDHCSREACASLAALRAQAPAGHFDGALCAPPEPGEGQALEVRLDQPEAPASIRLTSCDASAAVRLTLRKGPGAGTLVSIASAQRFRYGSEQVGRQGRHPQLGHVFERVADLADRSDVPLRPDGAFEVALTPTVENQVFYFFSLRRRDY